MYIAKIRSRVFRKFFLLSRLNQYNYFRSKVSWTLNRLPGFGAFSTATATGVACEQAFSGASLSSLFFPKQRACSQATTGADYLAPDCDCHPLQLILTSR